MSSRFDKCKGMKKNTHISAYIKVSADTKRRYLTLYWGDYRRIGVIIGVSVLYSLRHTLAADLTFIGKNLQDWNKMPIFANRKIPTLIGRE